MRDSNRLTEIETFLAVIDEGSFSAAALSRGMTPSAVSKMMTRLEQRLGALLLRRSTRKLQVTDEGQRFARRAREVIEALASAEREAGCGQAAGVVRIATSSAYANHILAPVLGPLLADYPELEIELIIGDRLDDLYSQPIDLAVRAGPLPDSSMFARSLGRSELVEVMSAAQVGDTAMAGGFAYGRRDKVWTGQPARLRVTDGNTLAAMAVQGPFRVRLSAFVVARDIAAGRLLRCDTGGPPAYEEFNLLYLGHAGELPRRVSVVLDHLLQHGRVDVDPAAAGGYRSS